MLQWIAEISFLAMVAFIGVMICIAVENWNMGKMIIAVAILLCLQTTISDLSPVFQRWSARIDTFQNTLDKVSNLTKGTWEMPMQGTITQGYNSGNHGVDIGAPEGTVVRASRKGTVKSVGMMGVYGLTVVIDHGEGMETLYGHNSQVLVKKGYPVIAGTKIALSGNTGESSGPHLHFEIRKNGATVDPMDYVKN